VARLVQAQQQAARAGERISALNLSPLEPDLQAMAEARLMRIDGNSRVQVYVHAATAVEEALGDIVSLGGHVERTDGAVGIVQAWVPLDALETLAARPSVRFIRPPDYGFQLPVSGFRKKVNLQRGDRPGR